MNPKHGVGNRTRTRFMVTIPCQWLTSCGVGLFYFTCCICLFLCYTYTDIRLCIIVYPSNRLIGWIGAYCLIVWYIMVRYFTYCSGILNYIKQNERKEKDKEENQEEEEEERRWRRQRKRKKRTRRSKKRKRTKRRRKRRWRIKKRRRRKRKKWRRREREERD